MAPKATKGPNKKNKNHGNNTNHIPSPTASLNRTQSIPLTDTETEPVSANSVPFTLISNPVPDIPSHPPGDIQNETTTTINMTQSSTTASYTATNAGIKPGPKYPKRKRDDEFDRTDFSKPLPINQKLFCYYAPMSKYYAVIVIDRRKYNEDGEIIPDPELEDYFRRRNKTSRRRNPRKNIDAQKDKDKDKDLDNEDGHNSNSNNVKNEDGVEYRGDMDDGNTGNANGMCGANSNPQQITYYDPDLVHEPPPEWTENHPYQYYIHYIGWDRRMDEWIPRDRLRLIEFVADDDISAPIPAPSHDHGHGDSSTFPLYPQKENTIRYTARDNRLTRWEKLLDSVHESHLVGHGSFSAEDIAAHEEATRTKNVATIQLGKYILDTWYYSPFPSEYSKFSTLYFCEYCLSFFGYPEEHSRHTRRCPLRHPPGIEIYRSKEKNVDVAVFEVDGAREKTYCENLSFISKLFLDHKTLEFDCSPFLFYILCEVDSMGYHVVGYFSKEKVSAAKYNLACILTLPCHQRKGYGKFLISLSYELSKIEKKVGSPEKPISDLGKVSYVSYWSSTLLSLLGGEYSPGVLGTTLITHTTLLDGLSLDELSQHTCIEVADIEETLKLLQILVFYRDTWVFSKSMVQQLIRERDEVKRQRDLKPKDPNAIFVSQCRAHLLIWTPFFSRPADAQAALDSGLGGGGYGVGGGRGSRGSRKETSYD